MPFGKLATSDSLRYLAAKLEQALAPTSHASAGTGHGVSTANAYGHARASSTVPKGPGAASAGVETASFARGDHVHPEQAMDRATATAIGAVRPDGATTTVDAAGVLRAVMPSEQAMFLAAHRVGSYLETDGANPTAWGGTWQQEPGVGPYTWKRTR